MPEPTITPGQICYEAYWPGLAQHRPSLVSAPPVAWEALPAPVQAAWEAAAQAVLETPCPGDTTCPACGAGDTVCVDHVGREDLQAGRLHRPMACACCAATWDNVYVLARRASLHLRPQEDHDA